MRDMPLLDCLTNLLTDVESSNEIGIGQHHGELLATETRQQIETPQLR